MTGQAGWDVAIPAPHHDTIMAFVLWSILF